MGVTSLVAKQVCFGPVKRATCSDFVAKSRTALIYQQQLFATWFVARLVWFEGGKTRNVVISFVLQQSFETSCTFLLPALSRLFLHVYRVAGSFWWSALHPLTKTFKWQTGKWWWNMKEIVTLFLYFLSSGRSVCRWRYQQGSKKRLIDGTSLKSARIGKPVRARY